MLKTSVEIAEMKSFVEPERREGLIEAVKIDSLKHGHWLGVSQIKQYDCEVKMG